MSSSRLEMGDFIERGDNACRESLRDKHTNLFHSLLTFVIRNLVMQNRLERFHQEIHSQRED